jgi:hypothetical protein
MAYNTCNAAVSGERIRGTQLTRVYIQRDGGIRWRA